MKKTKLNWGEIGYGIGFVVSGIIIVLLAMVATLFIEIVMVFSVPALKVIALNHPVVSLILFTITSIIVGVLEIAIDVYLSIFFWIIGYLRYLTGWILRMRDDGFWFCVCKMIRNPYSLEHESKSSELHHEFHGMRMISEEDTDISLSFLDFDILKDKVIDFFESVFKFNKKPRK